MSVEDSGPRVVYLTFDGLLQPLGWSQVAQPLMLLSKRGFRYRVISLEREADLRSGGRVEAVRTQLAQAGLDWTPLTYREGKGGQGVALNLVTMFEALRRSEGVQLVHARSYPPALVAAAYQRLNGARYLFDTRGYWIDERADEGRWFTRPWVYDQAKRVERRIYQRSAAVVSLTECAAQDVREGRFGSWDKDRPSLAIPTCADYDHFAMPEDRQAVCAQRFPELAEKLLVGYVGSVNASYQVDQALELFALVHQRRQDAHLLCATQQVKELTERVAKAAIPSGAVTIRAFSHDEMPAVLASLDWGLLLLREAFSKRASMPTKLAEFFATGVRPVVYGCNREVVDWVGRAETGLVLRELSTPHLKQAADQIASAEANTASLRRGRELTKEYFSWQSGVNRYAELLTQLLDS